MTAWSSSSTPSSQTDDFDSLVATALACRRCPAMDGRRRVLSRLNGPVPATVMLVGEAPGRLGAEITGVPFKGDVAGRRLDTLITTAGWSRDTVFITNAALCNPRDERGNNRSPRAHEVRNCSSWLEHQIELVCPRLVVALGATALRSLAFIAPHELSVRDAGRPPVDWNGRWLAAVYHPGARSAVHRAFADQQSDFAALGAWLRRQPAPL